MKKGSTLPGKKDLMGTSTIAVVCGGEVRSPTPAVVSPLHFQQAQGRANEAESIPNLGDFSNKTTWNFFEDGGIWDSFIIHGWIERR